MNDYDYCDSICDIYNGEFFNNETMTCDNCSEGCFYCKNKTSCEYCDYESIKVTTNYTTYDSKCMKCP